MLYLIGKARRDRFGKSVGGKFAKLLSGTAVAQAIAIASTPILTRIYEPADFGFSGIIVSVSGVLAHFFSLSLAVAIPLPVTSKVASQLFRGCTLLNALITSVSLFALVFISVTHSISSDFAPVVFMVIVASSCLSMRDILQHRYIRNERFGLISLSLLMGALLAFAAKIALSGTSHGGIALAASSIVGYLATTLVLLLWHTPYSKRGSIKSELKVLVALVKRYRDFPLYRLPQNVVNTLSHSIPIFGLTLFFGVTSAGSYTIAHLALGLPTILIGGSIGSVLYSELAKRKNRGEEVSELIIDYTKFIAIAAVPIYLLVLFLSVQVFPFVFGADWKQSGVFASLLSGYFFSQLISRPAVVAVNVYRMQQDVLIYELICSPIKFIAIFIGFEIWGRSDISVLLFSVVGFISYALLTAWVILKGRRLEKAYVSEASS